MKRWMPIVLLTTVAGCSDLSTPTPMAPEASDASFAAARAHKTTARLFHDYVAMGSSIAGGYISGGINATTQMQAYPVLLAAQAGARFRVPLLAEPGCPTPWIAPLTPAPGDAGCAGRATPFLPPTIGNLSVPGQTVGEAVSGGGGIEPLPALFLKGRTQLEAMLASKPTFVTVHLGDNDAFRAALSGSLSELTSLVDFTTSYAQVVQGMNGVPQLAGATLIGVTNPLTAAALLQPGAFFFLARDLVTGTFLGKSVNLNCSPVTALGLPNPLAANLVSYAIVVDPNFPEINCDPEAYPVYDPRRGAYIVDAAEAVVLSTRVAQFNAAIAQAAAANGWAYFDPNPLILHALSVRNGTGQATQIRKCQDLATAATAFALQAAVLNTCPVPGPTGAENLFGSLVSFDGVHPSAAGHALLAAGIAATIDAHYGTLLGGY